MVQQLDITVRLTAEERARLDEVRGATAIEAFMRNAALWYVEQVEDYKRRITPSGDILVDGLDDLRPEDHIRLADEGEKDAVDVEVVLGWLDKRVAQLKAKHNEATQ